jgi:hypothetical protein
VRRPDLSPWTRPSRSVATTRRVRPGSYPPGLSQSHLRHQRPRLVTFCHRRCLLICGGQRREGTVSIAHGLAVAPPGGSRTWTVVDADYRTVGPIEERLEAHRHLPKAPGLRNRQQVQSRSIRQWLQRRLRPANSNSHSPRFVKPFFSQILLEGPFVTAGKAWTCPNFRSARAFSKTSRTA